MLTDLLKWGGKRPDSSGRGTDAAAPRDEPVVASKAFPKFVATLSQKDAPVLLDLGPVIGSNVGFCGERLGCKLFIEDLVADVDRQLRGVPGTDLAASMPTRFSHKDGSIDGILCWDLFDFLDKASITGVVLRTDRFGNVVTNIDRRTFESVARSGTMEVTVGDRSIGRLVATYADIQPGEICALFGSTDHLELAANSESAADLLQLARGGAVAVNRR